MTTAQKALTELAVIYNQKEYEVREELRNGKGLCDSQELMIKHKTHRLVDAISAEARLRI